jgi:hypothetical protein
MESHRLNGKNMKDDAFRLSVGSLSFCIPYVRIAGAIIQAWTFFL